MDSRFRGNDAGGGGIIIKVFFLIAELGDWIPGSSPQPTAAARPRMTKKKGGLLAGHYGGYSYYGGAY